MELNDDGFVPIEFNKKPGEKGYWPPYYTDEQLKEMWGNEPRYEVRGETPDEPDEPEIGPVDPDTHWM